MNNILSNYPDIIKDALIPMIIAIFALGFPLIIQTIGRIDDKYRSTKLVEVFRKDPVCKLFVLVLIAAIASYIIWLFQLPPLVDWGWLIDDSALILILFSDIALTVMIFFIVHLAYVYYVPRLLVDRLMKLHNKSDDERKKTLYFDAISKILFYSINEADEPLARTLLTFYYEAFFKFREGKKGQAIEYPQGFYDTVFEANELLCSRKRKTISYFNDSTLLGLFLDEYQGTIISPKTYNFLWRVIVQSILYGKLDDIVAYWRKAHQLCSLFMPEISPKYDLPSGKIANQPEIDKRKKERDEFLEFHYVLGGLLMYKQQYKTIRELMNYTQSQPPRYVLVPERMKEIIERFMQIEGGKYRNLFYYEQKYWFPDNHGINSGEVIKMWVKRYLSILFVRQYTLPESYVYLDTLAMPKAPENLAELNHWKNELINLGILVNNFLTDKDVLAQLGLEQLSVQNWFEENKKTQPSVLIENFKNEIEAKFNNIKQQQPVAPDKETAFKEKTIMRLKPVLEKYSSIFANDQIKDNYQSYWITGRHHVLEKAAFSDNQDMCYGNADSITAECVAMEFQYAVLNVFLFMPRERYFFIEGDVFQAIDRLNINADDFAIISIGLNIDYYSHLKIGKLQKTGDGWVYNGIKIIETGNHMNASLSQSIFIVRKNDMPNMVFKKIDNQEYVRKYGLARIDAGFNIYAGLIDLNKDGNRAIKEAAQREGNNTDLTNSVLACVDINVEVQYRMGAKCVQLKVFSQFDDRGRISSLDDIRAF